MAHFYRKLLDDAEQNHEATVAATTKVIGPQGPTPNLTITKPVNYTPASDLELASRARGEGKDIELNDDNQIVDKRELLTAGLNLSGTNTRRLGQSKDRTKPAEGMAQHRAAGTAASRREIEERRRREIERQMLSEQERLAKEKEERERAEHARVVARRNDETSVQSAKERYLARKKQKLEQPPEVV